MGTFPAEIYGVVADFMVDIRPILLSCKEIYHELGGRADAEFWRLRDADRARVAPPKMYEFCRCFDYVVLIRSKNVDLIKYIANPREMVIFLSDIVISGNKEIFDYIIEYVSDTDDYVIKDCVTVDNLHAMKGLEKFTNIYRIVYLAAKKGAVEILAYYAFKCDAIDMYDAPEAAIKNGKIHCLKILHSAGVDLRGPNLLHLALYHSQYDIVRYLVECGARDETLWRLVHEFPDFYAAKNEFNNCLTYNQR